MTDVLNQLTALIAERAHADADTSYTRKLLDGGMPRIGKKLGEEAVEVVIAALGDDKEALKSEIADLLYHLLVLMQAGGISLDDVGQVLKQRFQQSGLQEKAARSPK